MVLAPDPEAAKRSKKLAIPNKWLSLGCDGTSAWGMFQGSGQQPYQVKLDLLKLQKGGEGWGCTCPSHKQPCKHCLGLLFIVVDQPDALRFGEAPPYVQNWLDKSAQRARKQLAKKQGNSEKVINSSQNDRAIQERKQKISAGLEELELWIINIIRHGLGDTQIGQYDFWNAKASRMVDAQAPGIAQWLRDMAGIPLREDQWVEQLLDQLGRLYLLIQGFKRFDNLSEDAQADLRMVLGWPLRREDVQDNEGVVDHWLVLGHHEAEMESKLRTQRLWLRGQESERDALISEFAYGDLPFDTYLWPGEMIEAELVFFPSR
ncbi:MAG TPA: SWIM zinc finger family protein [Oculatellaceae cyanobacterium]